MTSPVQVALRELMILTKCYCDGQHPRLGHNCSFRPDVERVVKAIADAIAACDDTLVDGGSPEEIRRALLGLPEPSITGDPGCQRCNYDTHVCPGCGCPLPHGIEACDECNERDQPAEESGEPLPCGCSGPSASCADQPVTRSVKDVPHAAQIAQRLQDAALRQKEGTVDPER